MPESDLFRLLAVDLSPGLSSERYELYLACLPAPRRKKIGAFLRREDSVRALMARILLRLTLGELLGIPGGSLEFRNNEYGKPALVYPPHLHFNLSHAGDWVALVTDTSPVGVDVEHIKSIELDIAKRFFAPREYSDLMALPEGERQAYFFDLWTLKESYIKALGMGLSLPLDSFCMLRRAGGFVIETERAGEWYFRQYPLDPAYKFSVCRSRAVFPGSVQVLSLEDVHEKFLLRRAWFPPDGEASA